MRVSGFVEAFDCVSLFAALLFVSDREELFFVSLLVPLFGMWLTKTHDTIIEYILSR